jgi:hypothetical protein
MDSLCCQAYYNEALITVLNLLLVGLANFLLNNKSSFSSAKEDY